MSRLAENAAPGTADGHPEAGAETAGRDQRAVPHGAEPRAEPADSGQCVQETFARVRSNVAELDPA